MCRALALGDGTTGFVLAALDLVGASGPLLEAIRDDGPRLTGLPPASVLLACTHSHASPDTQGLWGGTGACVSSRTWLIRRLRRSRRRTGAGARARARASTTALGGSRAEPPRMAGDGRDADDASVHRPEGGADRDADQLRMPSDGERAGEHGSLARLVRLRRRCGRARARRRSRFMSTARSATSNPRADGGFEAAQSLGEAVASAALGSLPSADDGRRVLSRSGPEPLVLPMNIERLSQRVQDAVGAPAPALSVLGKTGGLQSGVGGAACRRARRPGADSSPRSSGNSERNIIRRDGRTYLPTQCGHISNRRRCRGGRRAGGGADAAGAAAARVDASAAPAVLRTDARHARVLRAGGRVDDRPQQQLRGVGLVRQTRRRRARATRCCELIPHGEAAR